MSHDDGFTIVEMLVSLLVASLMLIAAYQLYGVINQDSSNSRQFAIASNIGYENMRTYAAQATSPCSVITPSPQPTVPSGSTLVAPTAITVNITCPFGTSSGVSKVTVKVSYGNPAQEVNHALFTTK